MTDDELKKLYEDIYDHIQPGECGPQGLPKLDAMLVKIAQCPSDPVSQWLAEALAAYSGAYEGAVKAVVYLREQLEEHRGEVVQDIKPTIH